MKTTKWTILAVMLAVVPALPTFAAGPARPLPTVREVLAANPAFARLFGTPRDCPGGQPCAVDVAIVEASAQGESFCIVRTPDLKIAYGDHPQNKHTPITWTLVPPQSTTATYTFERPHGLIVVKDDGNSTNKKADSISDTAATIDHKYKKKNGYVEYYPAVFQTSGDRKILCAAVDPIITND